MKKLFVLGLLVMCGSLPPQLWAAVINYRFSGEAMSAEDRLLNPLGFQVVRYRRDAELAPEVVLAQPVSAAPVPGVQTMTQPIPGVRRSKEE